MKTGILIKLSDDQDYVVPPLTLRQIQAMEDDINALGSGTIAEQAPRITRVVHAALSRNYDLTYDQVADLLDLTNMSAVVNAIMGVSGLKKEESPAAEPIGAVSTPTS